MEDRLLYLLESVLGKSKRTSNDNYAFFSPFVDHHKRKLEIKITLNNQGINKWHCWVSDEKGKTIKSLFKKLKVSKTVWDEYNSIFDKIHRYSNSENTSPNIQTFVQLPNEFKPLYVKSESIKYKHALMYVLNRGIRPSDIVKYNIGYCEDGEYSDRIIVPSYDCNGKLNFFVGRSFYKSNKVSYKNPKVSKDIIGFDMFINWNEPIVITEGIFDAISIRRNCIPLFGKSIQPKLEKTIIEKGVSEVYLCLDEDALKNAIRLAERLISYNIKVHLVEMNGGDAAELGYTEVNRRIYNTEPLTLRKLMEYKLMRI